MSPIMKQYNDLKKKHPDALILFRCGDFYEAYAEDAHTASKILGLTLSQRNGSSSKEAAMAGFPHHALDTYLPKLIRAGQRVAICDQLEAPKQTRKAKAEKQTTLKASNGNTESKAQQQPKVEKKGDNFEAKWDMAMDKFEEDYVEYADNKKVAESESLKQGIRFIPNGGSGKWSASRQTLPVTSKHPMRKSMA